MSLLHSFYLLGIRWCYLTVNDLFCHLWHWKLAHFILHLGFDSTVQYFQLHLLSNWISDRGRWRLQHTPAFPYSNFLDCAHSYGLCRCKWDFYGSVGLSLCRIRSWYFKKYWRYNRSLPVRHYDGHQPFFLWKIWWKLDLMKFMIASGILCLICYLLAALAPLPFLNLVGCSLCGFSVGIMWPGTISIASKKFHLAELLCSHFLLWQVI